MKPTLLNSSLNSAGNRKKGGTLFLVVLVLCLRCLSPFAQGVSSVTCPADIVQNKDAGSCTARVVFPVSNDENNNPDYMVTYSYNSGAAFPVGTTKVVKQLLDQNGAPISSCSFNVTVIDNEAPVITNCTSNITVNSTSGACSANVSYTLPTVYEACTLQRKTFFYSGVTENFVVPAGVTSINIDIAGGAGGHTFYNNSVYGFPGLGGEVYATIPVTPGQVLSINVAGAGQDGKLGAAGLGGFNGGGNGSAVIDDNNEVLFAAGGGGGESDIRTGGSDLTNRIVVAGGGGAAGINQGGGDGGDLQGESAESGNSSSTAGSVPATGGTQTEGGTGGSYQNSVFAGNGTPGAGGNGAADLTGGGGGGGFFGGGGGSFGAGAGGSSYAFAAATNVYHVQGAQEGNGFVTLTYDQPATLVQTNGLPSGSLFPVGETMNTFTATDAAGNAATCTFKVTVIDNQKPIVTAPADTNFNTVATSYTIPVATATDNCGIASVTYSVTGATTRNGSGADASGSFNAGTSVINYTFTDVHGNVQTATTTVKVASAATPIAVTIPDVYAVSPGGKPNTIYHGYGPSFVTLRAVTSITKTPLSYEWTINGYKTVISRNANLPVILPGEYTVTVTDAKGNTGTSKKQVLMEDVRCGNNNDKVIVCVPGKGNKKATTDCVNDNKVDKLLENGAYLGDCNAAGSRIVNNADEAQTIATAARIVSGEALVNTDTAALTKVIGWNETKSAVAGKGLNVYPNPTTGRFNIKFSNVQPTNAEISIFSHTGTTVQRKTVALTGAVQNVSFNIGNLARGMYVVRVVTDKGVQTAKVLLQ